MIDRTPAQPLRRRTESRALVLDERSMRVVEWAIALAAAGAAALLTIAR